MCCLFGIIDYRHSLSERQKRRMLSALAAAAEIRGTDATGIAYNTSCTLRIDKQFIPGHWMRFRGSTQGRPFVLTHNGVLYNDGYLRRSRSLPRTKIETDSYIAVQLIERK